MRNKIVLCVSVLLLCLFNISHTQNDLFDDPIKAYDAIRECLNGGGLCEGKSADKIFELVKNTISDENGKLKKGYEEIFDFYIWDSNILVDTLRLEDKYLAVKLAELFIKSIPEKNKEDINDMIHSGNTLLHLASEKGYIKIAKLLIYRGANINIYNKNNETPLHYASQKGHNDIVRFLIQNGASVNATTKSGMTPLHYASKWGHTDIAELLISKRASVSAVDEYNRTPLHCASQGGHTDIAELLISKKASVNATTNSGLTPLHYASQYGRKKTVELLLSKGAPVDIRFEESEWTPLVDAVLYCGNKDVVYTLLFYGADPKVNFETYDSNGKTNILKELTKIIENLNAKIAKERNAQAKEEYTKQKENYLYIRDLVEYMSDPQNQLKAMKNRLKILEKHNKTESANVVKGKIKELELKLRQEETLKRLKDNIPDITQVYSNT